MLSSIRDGPRLIDKKIFRGFSLSAVRECSRQTAKSTRRKSNRIHQLLNSTRNRSCDCSIALRLLVDNSPTVEEIPIVAIGGRSGG